MKFSISAAVFSGVLKQCARIASKKSDGAASHVLIDLRDGELSIVAQNGTQQIVRRTRTSSLRVEQVGAICVSALKLEQIVSAMPGDREVTVALTAEKLVLTCARSRFSLATLDVDSFPLIRVSEPTAEFVIDTARLREAGKTVASCCARADVRQFLNGVLLSLDGGNACLVASDGHRMGVADISGVTAPLAQVIIPITTIDDFLGFATESEARIRLYSNLAAVVSEAGEFYTKLIDGKYPDFRRLTTAHASPQLLEVNRADLLAAVQRAGLMADERAQGIKLLLGKDGIAVTAISDSNSAEESIQASYAGVAMEVGYNARYLQDVLKNIPSENVRFSFDGTSGGTHISPTNSSQLKFVLMPMRV